MRVLIHTLSLFLLLGSYLSANDTFPLGLRHQQQVIIPGGELEVQAITTFETPVVVRIMDVNRHGSGFRYDLEFYGLEVGNYNLMDFLQRKDGSPMDALPAIAVEFKSVLPVGQIKPAALENQQTQGLGGYRILMTLAVIAWVLGLLAIWLLGHSRADKMVATESKITFEEQLRPLVESAIAGRLPDSERAKLERMLLNFWRRRLDLQEADPAIAIARLREHEEAGPLLCALEEWLHRPHPPQHVDLSALLKPYRTESTEV